ncbi:copper chaperone CopZ [Mammaliicoccus sciuri]|uniref:copper chaperone CopZ n=1 Tax=Mammaliicoccus sciuri TaxID=1296 RepID=UPI000733CCAF|nr:copper chaperone CopZ [Mammaliicoccus sciuri]KTT85000.1 copper chaperone CopZ [Mammaliicoccus sciuri]MBA1395984.1 copper chaperone CopZ [Mammaliicoccus sciuri]MCJ0955653.1 copper chaperone CopZ [Mammaliicoccus sciuri]MEB8207405.1 copper chaperone CopZ [Mammaliicoccus sciuri]
MYKEFIKVHGMSCGHCKQSIEKALNELDGVNSSVVNLSKGEVEINFDENKVNFNGVKEAIENQGYEFEM